MRIAPVLLFLALAIAGCNRSPDNAASPTTVSADTTANVAASLLSEVAAIRPGEPFRVGLRMKIREGWHTYWKNPGDAGLPLKIVWTLPEGFTAGPIEWPTPGPTLERDLMTYGYEDEVVLTVKITPPKRLSDGKVTIAGSFDWLECKDVCLPGSAALGISLPVRSGSGPPETSPEAPLFAQAESRSPRPPTGWTFSVEAGPRAISLSFRPPPGISPRGAYLFVDLPLVAEHAAPQGFERVSDRYRLTLLPAPNAGTLERLTGVLVVEDEAGDKGTAVEVDVPVTTGDPAPAPASSLPRKHT